MYIDIVVAVIIFFATVFGLKNGFFVEFFSIFGVVINFILAKKITPIIIEKFSMLNNNNNYISVYMGTFWVLYIILGIFIYFITTFLKSQSKNFISRILGGVLGFLKGAVLVAVALVIYNFVSSRYPSVEKYSQGSQINKIFIENASYLEEYVPHEFKDKLKEIKDGELLNKYFNKLV
ncbi:CvpA family protein [Cetobacterium sp. SF1]|uniref:CvpA family protein n=1 Tax=unclassified Cetobacterium TaxID=2630983 RepID=UPI003CF7312A